MYSAPVSSSATHPSASDPTANERTVLVSSRPSLSLSRISYWFRMPWMVMLKP